MDVRRITLKHFMGHANFNLLLPQCGVVAVSGPNGSGKSSLVEGVCTAVWGKTLRGSLPWHKEADAEAEVELGDSQVIRRGQSRKGTSKFKWFDADGEDRKFANGKAAVDTIALTFGTFELWRRAHVFSSSDAAHFTLATDGERKRMLEAMLGADRFDTALERCRMDLRVAESHVATAVRDLERAEWAITAAEKQHTQSEERLLALGPRPSRQPSLLDATLIKRLEQDLAQYEAEAADVRDAAREAQHEASLAWVAASAAVDKLVQARASGACPLCGAKASQALVRKLESEEQEATVANSKAAEKEATTKAAAASAMVAIDADRAALNVKLAALREAWARETATRAECERWQRVHDAETKVRADAEADLATARDDAKRAYLAREEAARKVAVLKAVEFVLGLKGARVLVLARALSGIEAAANAWLARIAGEGLRLTLKPYAEKASGGTSDAIGLEVEGAGGGHGYKASSGGERRRLDVAILLALAEVTAAASGRTGGTLFFDEVFDALDQAGVGAVASALADLGRERCVVVVSHSGVGASVPGARELRLGVQ